MFGIDRTRRVDRVIRRSVTAAGLGLLLLATPLASAQDATTPGAITQFAFEPTTLQVPAGTKVIWTNHDAIVHSVTSGTPDGRSDTFDSGLFDEEGTFEFTFTDAGDYTYFCSRHNFMRGTVSVMPG